MERSRTRAFVLLILTAVLWSTGGVLIKYIEWNAPAIAATRSAIAGLMMVALHRSLRVQWTLPTVLAALAYTATVMLFVAATKLTTAANAILLQYTAPVHVALFGAWFLGEKPSRWDWITLVLVMFGMILFFVEELSFVGMTGNVLALLSGMAFGWMTLLMRKHAHDPRSGSAIEPLLLGNFCTALVGLPFAWDSVASVSAQSWLGLAMLGVFQLGLSYILYAQAIRHVAALEAVLIPVLEPLLNPLWVALMMNELPSVWAVLGGIIVVGAVTLRNLVVARAAKAAREVK
jgi:drug/metabolite transporter (DMT)-like permease